MIDVRIDLCCDKCGNCFSHQIEATQIPSTSRSICFSADQIVTAAAKNDWRIENGGEIAVCPECLFKAEQWQHDTDREADEAEKNAADFWGAVKNIAEIVGDSYSHEFWSDDHQSKE